MNDKVKAEKSAGTFCQARSFSKAEKLTEPEPVLIIQTVSPFPSWASPLLFSLSFHFPFPPRKLPTLSFLTFLCSSSHTMAAPAPAEPRVKPTKPDEEAYKASLAQANIEPPADSLDVGHTAKYAKLRLFTTEKGFDSAYVDAQLQAHEDAVATFKDYAANGPTTAVKAFAENTLPTLEHHLEMAKALRFKTAAKD